MQSLRSFSRPEHLTRCSLVAIDFSTQLIYFDTSPVMIMGDCYYRQIIVNRRKRPRQNWLGHGHHFLDSQSCYSYISKGLQTCPRSNSAISPGGGPWGPGMSSGLSSSIFIPPSAALNDLPTRRPFRLLNSSRDISF